MASTVITRAVQCDSYEDDNCQMVKVLDILKENGIYSPELLYCGVHTRRKLSSLLSSPQSLEPMNPDTVGTVMCQLVEDDGSVSSLDDHNPIYYSSGLSEPGESEYVLAFEGLKISNAEAGCYEPSEGHSFRDHLVAIITLVWEK